jgi:NADPH-dependent 2,4-dienoyl-CoA reductase/sulfur reductase-like enzyme
VCVCVSVVGGFWPVLSLYYSAWSVERKGLGVWGGGRILSVISMGMCGQRLRGVLPGRRRAGVE